MDRAELSHAGKIQTFPGKQQIIFFAFQVKKEADVSLKFELLYDFHRVLDLPRPWHPLTGLISEKLDLTPSYLNYMLCSLTGGNVQQVIHDKFMKEKEKKTNLSVLVSESILSGYLQVFTHFYLLITHTLSDLFSMLFAPFF